MFNRALSIPLVLLALQTCLTAQTERTNLTGIVTDPQGNRIPQAKVVAVQTETGLKRQTAPTPRELMSWQIYLWAILLFNSQAKVFRRSRRITCGKWLDKPAL